jgi:hypothetical protein
MKNKALYVLIATSVAFAVVLGLGLANRTSAPSAPDDNAASSPAASATASPRPSGAEISVTGKIVCLPHKDQDGPQTMECAYGIQTADGKYYGVKDDQGMIIKFNIGDQVVVKGGVSVPDANENYAVVGNLVASSVTRAQ